MTISKIEDHGDCSFVLSGSRVGIQTFFRIKQHIFLKKTWRTEEEIERLASMFVMAYSFPIIRKTDADKNDATRSICSALVAGAICAAMGLDAGVCF